ncbi:MAG: aminodeoxychorismate/anthranilate synthase component II [Flammeovirgaceae bacterium]|nr:aminodeoxychorismate/anthranilate synthase component II [Flammeovirgaceae bacterium]MDW8286457.1 aminodeoxychorismate/anthranilate synthase component II [Flammeovirgaceae bacterium]
MNILVLDNYDSFTFNLVHMLRELGLSHQMEVHRNDKISLDDVDRFDHILLSPGPGVPSEAGIMPRLIERYSPTKSILGICLGHQGIAESFGAYLINIPDVLHGVANVMTVLDKDERLFKGIPSQFKVGHYHSWAVKPKSIPKCIRVTGEDELGHIMALTHTHYDVKGLQFHPESVMTEHGYQIMKNWLNIT